MGLGSFARLTGIIIPFGQLRSYDDVNALFFGGITQDPSDPTLNGCVFLVTCLLFFSLRAIDQIHEKSFFAIEAPPNLKNSLKIALESKVVP